MEDSQSNSDHFDSISNESNLDSDNVESVDNDDQLFVTDKNEADVDKKTNKQDKLQKFNSIIALNIEKYKKKKVKILQNTQNKILKTSDSDVSKAKNEVVDRSYINEMSHKSPLDSNIEMERLFKKQAKKGVIQLFNAVRQYQISTNNISNTNDANTDQPVEKSKFLEQIQAKSNLIDEESIN